MEPSEIQLGDMARLFIGEVPGSFYIEVVLRTIIIYFLLLLSMRLIGKRMATQVGRNEMAAMVSLAAAIGVPIQAPDRGLLPAIVIAFVIVGATNLIATLIVRYPKLESITQGNLGLLVEDAVMNPQTMTKVRISRERLFAQLRSNHIIHLGEVERLYFEANGAFTLIRAQQPKPGLSIIPDWDTDYQEYQVADDTTVCASCGNKQGTQNDDCTKCGNNHWVKAIK